MRTLLGGRIDSTGILMLGPDRLKIGAFVLDALDHLIEARNGVDSRGDVVPRRVKGGLLFSRKCVVPSFLIERVQDEKATVGDSLLKTLSQH
jgi:hypothetical protein